MIFLSARSRLNFVNMCKLALISLGVGLTTGIFGCSTMVVEEEAVQAQAPAVEKSPQASATAPAAIKEATLEEQPFKLQEFFLHEERGQTTFRMKFSKPVNQYRHFSLTQPARVVLDIYGETKRLAQVESFYVNTHWVGTLRLSSSEGYLRVVMEIAAATLPAYVIEPENGGLKVIVGPVNPQLTAKKDLQLVQGGKRTDVQVAEAKAVAPGAPSPAPTSQAGPAAEKEYTGQRISLDFKDADIQNVFRLLAEVSGLNLVVTEDVKNRVTVRLVDVPWDQALDLLIETNGLAKERVGNVLRISTAGKLKAEKDALAAAKKAEENLEPLQTSYLSINYAKVEALVDKIKPVLSSRGVIISDARSNTLIVRDIKKGIDEANTIVSRLDTRTPQILIESNLIETTPSFARALGFELKFSAPFNEDQRVATVDDDGTVTGRSASLDSPFRAGVPLLATTAPFFSIIQDRVGAFRNIQAILTAAEEEGNIKIISRPSVVTLNNVPSTIQSLRVIRIALPSGTTNIASGTGSAAGAAVATESINVGITLTVTPQVSADGFVLMNITVKSSSLAASATDGGVGFDELTREAISNVLVRDGETIVIGGIMKDTSSSAQSGIPYLKDIPLLGFLFRNIRWQKDFEELMVFITPRIISAGSADLPSAEQLWRDQYRKTEGG